MKGIWPVRVKGVYSSLWQTYRRAMEGHLAVAAVVIVDVDVVVTSPSGQCLCGEGQMPRSYDKFH